MDKRLNRDNIELGKHLAKDLEAGRFEHALKVSKQIDSNTHKINKEISSGKARRERT